MSRNRLLLFGLVAALCRPGAALAQDRPTPRVEPPHFDFRPDGVWRRQARQIRANRARLLAQRQFATLNAPMARLGGAPISLGAPSPSAAVVSGVLRVPAVLFKYSDTPASSLRSAAQYDQILFASTPPPGRPYTYRSYYEQLSHGLLRIEGKTYGYAALDGDETTYTGGTSDECGQNNPLAVTNCNGLFSGAAISAMQGALKLALQKVDNQVDWTQYDSDGDGFVDLVVFLTPTQDGSCGPLPSQGTPNNHLWAHHFFLSSPYQTHSVTGGGTRIKVSDYILQSGLGGVSLCDTTELMPIGAVVHETGHGLGLPDLYDTGYETEGIGRWGLMGAGGNSSPLSPARMEAWSLNELGWVTLAPLSTSGAYTLGAAPSSDSAFLARPTGSNPRGEYFLLENRQAVEADTALIRNACQVWYQQSSPPPCGGGLLIWQVDSQQVVNGGISYANVGVIHALQLLQADRRGNLDANPFISCVPPVAGCADRGDAGDVFPGTTGNTVLAVSTIPSNGLNSGGCAGFQIDSITQLVPNGAMRFVLRFAGGDTLQLTTSSQLPAGRWGYSYAVGLRAACGNGTYTWAVDSGAAPSGTDLSPTTGVLSGAPIDTGAHAFRVSVTDGTRTARRTMTLQIVEPELALQQALEVGFQGPAPDDTDQRRYLDLQNNADGTFDIGDLLRWLVRTGNATAAAALARGAEGRR